MEEGDCNTSPPPIIPRNSTARITVQLLNKKDFKLEKKEKTIEKGRNKLKEKGLEIRESKEDFTSRMKKNYRQLKTKMTGDQKVAMVYDKTTNRSILKIER